MICYKCGYENKGGDKFCSRCKAVLDYHEIDAKKIDISGLSLAEKEGVEDLVEKPSRHAGSKVAIAGIIIAFIVVAAILVPNYLSRAKTATILEAITSARKGVEAYVREHRVWPATESDIKLGSSEYLKTEIELVIKKGVITLSIPEEPGKKATISPSIKKGRIVWECDNGGIGPEYLPIGCFK